MAKKAALAKSKKSNVAAKTVSKSSKKSVVIKAQNKTLKPVDSKSQFGGLSKEILLQLHSLMVRSRVLEERLIKIYKAGESFFWIGGPGEEAWGVALGMLVNKGQGLEHDWLHLHYRCTPTLVAMGMPMLDSIRMMMNRSTDICTGGRNFSNHYCFPKWNVAPVTSPLEVQYPIACGTAHAQKRVKSSGISIVTGGDAGTAEGDFASCLILASRKNNELPLLITVQNNKYGISTPYEGQHGESAIADRAKAFNIKSAVINGNDPVETYLKLTELIEYIRETGKPAFVEAHVSRLYGHSSASGANKVEHEFDCVLEFEKKLIKAGLLTAKDAQSIWEKNEVEGIEAQEQARKEPSPTADTVWDHSYVGSENADWRNF